MTKFIPLKEILPEDMSPREARLILRLEGKFKPHCGRWEFPQRVADRVENYLNNHA